MRDQLKAGLSQAAPEPGTPPVAEIAGRIKALQAAHSIDAAPERTASRRIAAEEPVTARIRRRAAQAQAIEPPADPEPAASPAEMPPAAAATPARREEPLATSVGQAVPQAAIHPFPETMPSAPALPHPTYREHVARARRQNDRQLNLF